MHRSAVAIVLVFASAPLAAQAPSDSAAVVDAVHGFHQALAAGDSLAALGHLHADALIFESGHAETRAEYRSGHLRADIGFATATRREVTAEAVAVLGDAALYTGRSRTTGRVRDRDVDVQGTETIVLVRTSEGWRIRHIHWSSQR